jgi:hypothetical protein
MSTTLAKYYQIVLLGVTYTKIGTIQRRLAWPLHKDDTLVQSGRSTDRNIYFSSVVLLHLLRISMLTLALAVASELGAFRNQPYI